MARCTSCGAELPDYYTSCPNCGGTQVVRGTGAPQMQQSASYSQPAMTQTYVTSFLGWIGWLLLCTFVPIIGQIVMLCVSKDPSAKNYAKLSLILMAILLVLCALLAAILVPAMIGYVQKAESARVVYGMIQAFIH